MIITDILRDSSFPLIMTIEAGANRAAYPAGMAAALEAEGLSERFVRIYGVSSGAFVGAAFAAGKASRIAAAFINEEMRRFISRSLKFDLDHVFDAEKGLPVLDRADYQRIATEERLRVMAYKIPGAKNPDTIGARSVTLDTRATATVQEGFTSAEALVTGLKIGAHFPGLSTSKQIPQKSYDGGIAENSGILTARRDFPDTHIIGLANRPWGQPVSDARGKRFLIQAGCIVSMTAQMGIKDGRKARLVYRDNLLFHDQLFAGWYRNSDPFVHILAPSAKSRRISQIAVNRKILSRGVFEGMRAAYAAMGCEHPDARADDLYHHLRHPDGKSYSPPRAGFSVGINA